jgi:hypothetical protein
MPAAVLASWSSKCLRSDRPAEAICTATGEQQIKDTRLGAAGYAFTRFPDAADFSMAAMTSWRRTASAKSGTV